MFEFKLPISSFLRKQEFSDFAFKDKSHWIPIIMGMTALLISINTLALETPHTGKLDKRVRHINYQSEQVVKLVGHYGFSTDIAFAQGERIKQIAMGDSDAWSVTPVANHIFIKPKDKGAITNMTVLTAYTKGSRVYNFELSAHWSQHDAHPFPNDMMFAIDFRYPAEQKLANVELHEKQLLQQQLNRTQAPKVANQAYFYKGDDSIAPTKAFDDGRFTYLTFNRKQDLPAIYIVNSDNSESLVNSNVNPNYPDTIIIERVVKQLVLRQGNRVACVFNIDFATEQSADYQTSNIPHVVRHVIKKGGKSDE
ncbi:P-type conjugative transfer protein VirB9 [Shewanella sp. 202IG2-18]|uniref:P-type conjugative transfer protein VirB9 n=1 Tax=Parashewanella hymeniacidonis TaxID=2807618 RepID=UPI00195F9D73|nr:P-type conjugative transfer protein VirB9 [Parashewanella hymeniacidonis]MBM7070613.1 P-type conjugative transfer protein VirB9 [Parashewanella hymeniacidonis]